MRYKLIKELPNCNIGDVAVSIQNYFVWETSGTRIYYLLNPTEAKGWWEEIIERDFKVLEFYNMNEDLFILEKGLYYCSENNGHGFTLNSMLHAGECVDNGNFAIHKVKCLSIDEVFTIGDSTNKGKIERFYIISDTMRVDIVNKKECCHLHELKHAKKPIFSTLDGVDIQNLEVLSLNDIKYYLIGEVAEVDIKEIIKKKLNIK